MVNIASLIIRYYETICRIHTVLSQLNTSSNKGILTSIWISHESEYDPSITMQYCSSVHKREASNYVPRRGIYRFKKRPLGFPTLQLPDGSASLRPWPNMRPVTCGSNCDLWLRCRCDLRLRRMRDLRLKELSYGSGRVIERSGASIFFPLRKSRQVW